MVFLPEFKVQGWLYQKRAKLVEQGFSRSLRNCSGQKVCMISDGGYESNIQELPG